VCPETSFLEILGDLKGFSILVVNLYCVWIYLELRIRGNLGLNFNCMNLKSVGDYSS
jgi:hypothetical protein